MEKKACCIPAEWIELELLDIRSYNHDTSIFSFGLPAGELYLNLPTCACLLLLAPNAEHDNKGDAIRPYTPISPDNLQGKFELLIKRYDEWGHKFEPGSIYSYFSYNETAHAYKPKGVVSNYIFNLSIGSLVKFKHIPVNVKIQYPFHNIKTITMIAVGVGIAPMIQALHSLLNPHNNDTTHIRLLYGVRKVPDILLREKLDEWADRYKDRFQIVYGVGSRWGQVYFGAKTTDEYVPPELPTGYSQLLEQLKQRQGEPQQLQQLAEKLKLVKFEDGESSSIVSSNNNEALSDAYIAIDTSPSASSTSLSSSSSSSSSTVANISAELGWIDEDKISRYAFPPSNDTKVFVCGLPGVYLKLCGPRTTTVVTPGSALYNLGYADNMVVKF